MAMQLAARLALPPLPSLSHSIWLLASAPAPLLWCPVLGDQSVVKWLGIYVLSLWAAPLAWRGKLYINGVGLALLSLAGLSLLWSPDPRLGALGWLNAATLFLVVSIVASTEFKIAWPWYALGALALDVLWPDMRGWFINDNFISHFLLLTVPFCLTKRLWPIAGLSLASIFWRGSDEIWLVLGLLYVWGTYWLGRAALRGALSWFVPIVAVLAPINFVLLSGMSVSGDSFWSRAELWTNSIILFLDHPWGVGLGGFDHVYPAYDFRHLQFFDNHLIGANLKFFAFAAHNEWLQLLVVLGPAGLILGIILVWVAWPREIRLRLALSVVVIIGLVNFPYQLPGSALLAGFVLGLCLRSRLQQLRQDSANSGQSGTRTLRDCLLVLTR